jgi:hexulose-6-phosphate isomerase
MFEIGMMQGRLTPPKGRGIQFFPFDNWEQEFIDAQKIGITSIEFIFDLERYQENPLWTDVGIARINELQKQTGVRVDCICLDYFMRNPFYRVDQETYQANIQMLKLLIERAAQVGAKTVEIPILDNASLKTDEEKSGLISAIRAALPVAEKNNIIIGIEADLPPQKLVGLLNEINHPLVQAVYDSGNSASLGYDSEEEIRALAGKISSIQIKDRIRGGTTVDLGTGSADFNKLFQSLKEAKYRGNFILQSARGTEGQEVQNIAKHISFIREYIQKYLV